MEISIPPDELFLTVSISPADGDDYGALRRLTTNIECMHDEGYARHHAGRVSGWLTWDAYATDLIDAGDAISHDAVVLATTARELVDSPAAPFIDAVLLIDRMTLAVDHRGHQLTGTLVNKLVELLQLEPEETLVVLQPEPQTDNGPYPDGPAKDRAMARLQNSYRVAGFEPWGSSDVWWRPLGDFAAS
ncbi:hypothetical protein [Brachybacterium sp. FME24]|uniref:hypothetical protein n=1 Tax=Brachybacterium sp. FME24 TaxID=2742605 RepID=UPI0018661A64|nr:hypothetical protein [Brachybacterium sp. FME24]